MKVLKFGGTSVGTPRSLTHVREVVEAIPGQAIVVVSALGGVTDMLIKAARMACDADMQYKEVFEAIRLRHLDVIEAMVPECRRAEVLEQNAAQLVALERLYLGVSLLGELTRRTHDLIVSFGERMSAPIVTAMLSDAELIDSLDLIKTETWAAKDVADIELTTRLIKERAAAQKARIAVAPGFISTDRESGRITNLGRGGSDYTAAIIAAAIGAEVLEIWTDVDGFMTGDPRVIASARVIDSMTFTESMQLCNYGAKVIYPPTIYPVFHKNIPIIIKNTFNPAAPGTYISDARHSEKPAFRGISSISSTPLITVGYGPTANGSDISSRILNILSKNAVSVIMLTRQNAEGLQFAVREDDAAASLDYIRTELAAEIADHTVLPPTVDHECATIALVGENVNALDTLRADITRILDLEGIPSPIFALTNSATVLPFALHPSALKSAINIVHDSLITQ